MVFSKPCADDNIERKGYLSISLLRCIENVVETSAIELLSEEGKTRWQLIDGQFGSRNGLSAIDAAAIIVDSAHAALKAGHIVGVLLMDIKAVFSTMPIGRVINIKTGRNMDGDGVQ